LKQNFNSPNYTIGVEEELMILDGETYALTNEIELLLAKSSDGDIKPELLESVLEIATKPCRGLNELAPQLRSLRRQVAAKAMANNLCIGASGTHPFSIWEDQRVVARSRYRDLISSLRFVARQEIIFGLHVHVGIDSPEKAIHVANGMRVHVPLLLALSANSPFWRSGNTGLASVRMPIFRAFPRVGIPPFYQDWEDYQRRIKFMIDSRVIEDYTFLWYDVRPHPSLGTVEIRAMDSQTRVEHTLALTALIQAMVKELSEHFDEGKKLSDYPYEMLDENKWLAARHGLDGELVDLPGDARIPTKVLAMRIYDRLKGHAQDLGSLSELEGIIDLIERGNGAARQLVVYEANGDFVEVVRDIVAASEGSDLIQPHGTSVGDGASSLSH
jgi:glutamate---cysteine ligase / carboxylate-amine ligase